MSQEVWKNLRADCKGGPFSSASFKKRGDAYYVSVELAGMKHEANRRAFYEWLKSVCSKYSWMPYITSGGMGKYTYRLNGNLEIFQYANL